MKCIVCKNNEAKEGSVCDGCLQPERLEAQVDKLPDPFKSLFLRMGRDMNIIPKKNI